jgi:hypothetical protein
VLEQPTRWCLIACLGLAGCGAPNSPGQHRDLVLRPGDELTSVLALSIAREYDLAGEEPPLELLSGLTGRDGEAVFTEAKTAGDTVVDGLMGSLDLIEDLVEGVLTDMLGEAIDFRSPTLDLSLAALRVVERQGGTRVLDRHIRTPWMSPALSWATAYLAVHLGPEHWNDLDPDDPLVQRFSDLVATYALLEPGRESARALVALRLIEQSIYDEFALSAESVDHHDLRYDGLFFSAQGFTRRGPSFLHQFELRISNANWTTRQLFATYVHELGHFILWNRRGLWNKLRSMSHGPFRGSVTENGCDLLAELAIEHLLAQRMQLGELDPAWLDEPILGRVPEFGSDATQRLSSLYAHSRSIGNGWIQFEVNAAQEDTHAEYRSLQDELRLLADAYGVDAALDLIVELDDRAELDALIAAVEAGSPLEQAADLVD